MCQNISKETTHAWLARVALPTDINRLLGVASTQCSSSNRGCCEFPLGEETKVIARRQSIPMFKMTQHRMGFYELENSWLKFQLSSQTERDFIPKSGILKVWLFIELDYILMKMGHNNFHGFLFKVRPCVLESDCKLWQVVIRTSWNNKHGRVLSKYRHHIMKFNICMIFFNCKVRKMRLGSIW